MGFLLKANTFKNMCHINKLEELNFPKSPKDVKTTTNPASFISKSSMNNLRSKRSVPVVFIFDCRSVHRKPKSFCGASTRNRKEREISRQASKNKALKDVEEQHKKSLEEDPSMFDYDGVYDEMKENAVHPISQDRMRESLLFALYFRFMFQIVSSFEFGLQHLPIHFKHTSLCLMTSRTSLIPTEVGMIAENDGIILCNHIPRILKKHFHEKSYYIDLVDMFNEHT
ncbi:unnamed protein product [Lactuca saligna]|uniref:Nuclear speckle splicing regulatory protein 1 N-terminal domain-containing protein n=1 Tax=Lactuca saligna TaxID=75948 RepID=A0AA36EA79_LACSI|nr:unnamed protein product [Lactuca saligna]